MSREPGFTGLRRHRSFTVALIVGLYLMPSSVAAQIPDAATCPTCRMQIQEIVRITTGISRRPSSVMRDMQGRFWMAFPGEAPVVFDPSGRLIKSVARIGSGPLEVRAVATLIPLPGDSVLALDPDLQRALLIDPSLNPVRPIRLPGSFGAGIAVRWPDTLVLAGSIRTPRYAGLPLHTISIRADSALITKSFGSESGELRPGDIGGLARRLTPAAGGGIWAAEVLEYQLVEWGPDGSRKSVILRRPSWFSTRSQWSIGTPETPPFPAIDAIYRDTSDRLWVFVRRPRDDWATAWPSELRNLTGAVEIRAGQGPEASQLYYTLIEVLAPDRLSVLSRAKADELVVNTMPGDLVAMYGVDPIGVPYVRIVAIRLIHP